MGSTRRKRPPPYAQAWLSLGLPILAWLSQIVWALVFMHRAGAILNALVALVQFGLMAAGLGLGIWALAVRGKSGAAVILPAAIGVVISAGSFLLICLLMMLAVLR